MRISQIVAAQGAFRQHTRISNIIANNLSNAQTAGFKKEIPVFNNILSQAQGHFQVMEGSLSKISFLAGNIQKTGNNLDLAIEGEGFFKVKIGDEVRYTRAGNFGLNKDRVLVNAEGAPVLGRGGEITLNGSNIEVTANGSIIVDGNEVDQIAVVTFPNLDILKKEGHTLLQAERPEEIAADQSQVVQGALEASNVNPIEEMINLLDAYRTYEACMKIIQSDDSMDAKSVNEVGKV